MSHQQAFLEYKFEQEHELGKRVPCGLIGKQNLLIALDVFIANWQYEINERDEQLAACERHQFLQMKIEKVV
jgi:hypothetical protein